MAESGDVALFLPGTLYWYDPHANRVAEIALERHVSAIGFVNDSLLVVSTETKRFPQATPGIEAYSLFDPRLSLITRAGTISEIASLPEKATGITKIDPSGRLIAVTKEWVRIFETKWAAAVPRP